MPKVADVQAVYGEFEVDWYKQRGVREEELKIIGHPRFDDIRKGNKLSLKQFIKKTNIDKTKKSVLLVGHHEETAVTRTIIHELSKNGDVNLIIKPRGSPKETKILKKRYPNLYVPPHDLHLYDLLRHVDAVVSYPSTVALEALLAGKTVFIWGIKTESTTEYFGAMDHLLDHNPLALTNKVCSYLKSTHSSLSDQSELLKAYYPEPDQSSTGRLIRLINTLTT
nr:hypothetical protein [Halobacillus sp. A1]